MSLRRHILILLACLFFHATALFAQPGFKVDVPKPKPYQERKLKAEKTGDGKLKTTKRILQNLTTHFNYYFNASNKLAEILERAKRGHRDDYSQLLSFYNYDLDITRADSSQLDSVIYKARTSILNHDLRNEWNDELYLLWGAAWHLEKKFDSAALMLQFINYAYAPQEEDGYYRYIGTHTDGARELTIATKEDKKFFHNNNFSRNTAFIWQIRTRIEQGDMTAAGGLISTLRRDPNFPGRLTNPLDEVEAYYQYRQHQWDSAATHLLAALDGDYPKLEKARWTFLAAQLREKAGKTDEALKLYEKAIALTPDPIMEVYARLNLVRLNKEGGEGAVDKNVAELLKMAKRDKYEEYRDIIYYMAAQMELERNNVDAANELLIKGAKYNNGNASAKNKAFLQIADFSFQQKKYIQAAAFYDSVQVADLKPADADRVNERRPALQRLVQYSATVYRQDSLQRVAAMPEEERTALVKKIVKRLRKEQGLKEEATLSAGSSNLPLNGNAAPTDLFSQQKGEWYFYNAGAKAQGSATFKSIWGNRPNVDNWRRFAVVNQGGGRSPNRVAGPVGANPDAPAVPTAEAMNSQGELSLEALLRKLPTTPESLKVSNDSIRNALFNLGVTYLEKIEDYPLAIATFEELRRRFPNAEKMDEVLFHLFYAYSKSGNATAAAQAKKLLADNYSTSRFASIVATGKDPQAPSKSNPQATKDYENVYRLFIEGQFTEAESAKRVADSTYKTNFWQPQLLYIEAVYYIRQRQDSVAKKVLGTIVSQNSSPVLTEKAIRLVDVLNRRQQIEDELTRLQITRPSDDDSVYSQPVASNPPAPKRDTAVSKPIVATPPKDTVAVVKKPEPKPVVDTAALAKARKKELADSLAFSKLLAKRMRDSLATVRQDSLARKALADKQHRDSVAAAKRDSIAYRLALQKQATDSAALRKYFAKRATDSLAKLASDSIALAKKKAADARADSLARKALAEQQRRDSLATARAEREKARRDSIAQRQALLQKQRDSAALAKQNAKPPVDPNAYQFKPDEPQYAMVVLDKVDPIFVNEAKNAFERYNKERFYNQGLEVQILNLTADTRILMISGLRSVRSATDYITGTKSIAATEIIPWLTANKYSFSMISAANLELLKAKGDVDAYKRFLEQHLPGKF